MQTTVAFIAQGSSTAALLAAAAHLLAHDEFGGLAVAWTVGAIFGLGVASPVELYWARQANVGVGRPCVRSYFAFVGVGTVLSLAVVAFASGTPATHAYQPLAISAAAAVAGWVLCAAVRSRLAGWGDLRAYSAVVILEAMIRAGMVAGAVLLAAWRQLLLGAAIGVPMIVAGIAALVTFRPPDGGGSPRRRSEGRRIRKGLVGFLGFSVGYQLCLTAPPLLIAHNGEHMAFIGQFVAANTYFRSAAVLMGGFATQVLVASSHAWACGDMQQFRSQVRTALCWSLVAVGTTEVALMLMSGWALPAYYGRPLSLPPTIYVALAISTGIAVGAAVISQAALAAGRMGGTATFWLVGAAITLGSVALARGSTEVISIGLVAGPVGGLVGCARSVQRSVRVGPFVNSSRDVSPQRVSL